jgi:hypothetical protein
MPDFTHKSRSFRKRDIQELVRQSASKPGHRTLRSWEPRSEACPFPVHSAAAERWAKAHPEIARTIPYFQKYFFLSEGKP